MKNTNFEEKISEIRKTLAPYKAFIKRPAKGALKFDYLVPGGYYQEQWDWDAFFMGVALSSEISSEAIYLRNWALNYIINADKEGYSPGCVTPEGPAKGHRKFVMKPFLAQGVYLACKFLKDSSWVKPYWTKLKLIISYREKHLFNKKYHLFMWTNSMESGADDNVASFGYPDKTVASTDVNTYMYREYKALSKLALLLNKKEEAKKYEEKAKNLKRQIQKYLWNKDDVVFYNLDVRNGKHIRRIALSSFIPLLEDFASKEDGKSSLKKYVLNADHLWSKFGIRSLSKQDKEYNNVNRIHPYSNWQGPIWPIANYLYMQELLNYGFQKEAISLSLSLFKTVQDGINKIGGMRENYDAETGVPMAAPNFVSWNLLIGNMLDEAVYNKNPFSL